MSKRQYDRFHVTAMLLLAGAIVGFVLSGVLYQAFDTHVPLGLDFRLGLTSLSLFVFACVVEIARWLYSVFKEFGRWARMDSWAHYAPIVAGASLLAIAALGGYYYLVRWHYHDMAHRGQFGDSFGALNALISTCGFFALWMSIALQRRQLMEEDKRESRRMWPVCVFEIEDAQITIHGLERGTWLLFYLTVGFRTRNLTDNICLNVVNATSEVWHYADGDEHGMYPGVVVPFIAAKKVLESRVTLVRGRKDLSADIVEEILSSKDSRLNCLTIAAVYTNVTGSYYKSEQKFRVRVLSDGARLKTWLKALSCVRKKLDKKSCFGCFLNAELESAFNKLGFGWGDSTKLKLDFIPGTFAVSEITAREYEDFRKRSLIVHSADKLSSTEDTGA